MENRIRRETNTTKNIRTKHSDTYTYATFYTKDWSRATCANRYELKRIMKCGILKGYAY